MQIFKTGVPDTRTEKRICLKISLSGNSKIWLILDNSSSFANLKSNYRCRFGMKNNSLKAITKISNLKYSEEEAVATFLDK